jgi:hypothetical protein
MEFINAKTSPVKTEDFIQTCKLQRFYEVQRYDVGKTIKVELKPEKEPLEQYQFPYTEQGLQHAKTFAFSLYNKTACRELRSHEKTLSSKLKVNLKLIVLPKVMIERLLNLHLKK